MERKGEWENIGVIRFERKGDGDTEESTKWKMRAKQSLIFKKSYVTTTL